MPSDVVATIKMDFSPRFIDMMAFMDDVDGLCEALPDWYPGRAETVARIQKQALRLCRESVKESQQ